MIKQCQEHIFYSNPMVPPYAYRPKFCSLFYWFCFSCYKRYGLDLWHIKV